MGKLSLIAIGVCLSLGGCCSNEAPAEHPSPDGAWKYVTFDRNCGATTRNNLQISVLRATESLSNTAANAFIADDNRGATRFVAQPEWLSPSELKITYSAKARIYKKETKVGVIAIQYVEVP